MTASSAAPIYLSLRIEGRDYVDAGIGRPAFFDLAVAEQVDLLVIMNPMAPAFHSPFRHGVTQPEPNVPLAFATRGS